MIIIPEIKIAEIIETCLRVIEVDFESHLVENDSLLYKIFGSENQRGKYNFYTQAKEIFLRNNGHPRKIEVRMLFDAQRANFPTIHITMPQESNGADGIGVDEGYQENIVDTDKKTFTKTYTRMFDCQYNCIITSDNSFEVLCIYHLIKSLLISIFDTVELNGIRNPKLSGQDLQLNSDVVPVGVFVRGVGLNFSYEQTVPSIQAERLLTCMQFIGTME